MARIEFQFSSIAPLIEYTLENDMGPSFSQIYDGQFYPDGVVVEKDGRPDPSAIDSDKLPKALWLVKDEGVYLMAGTKQNLPREDGKEGSHVVYAEGFDPGKDEDVWERARAISGDDFADVVELRIIDAVLAELPDATHFIINVTPQTLSFGGEKRK